jgi:hypothetical protein
MQPRLWLAPEGAEARALRGARYRVERIPNPQAWDSGERSGRRHRARRRAGESVIFRRGRRAIAAGLATLLVTALSACNRSAEVRYRVTVEVEDNGTLRSGSSVWAFRLTQGLFGSLDPRFRGEAVAVDLPGRGTLFALVFGRTRNDLLGTDTLGMLPEHLLGDIGRVDRGESKLHKDRIDDLSYIALQAGATATIDCAHPHRIWDDCPYLVRFRDPHDAKTVEPVDPKRLDLAFGKGVTLQRISIQITHDPVTTSIQARLPSFGKETGWRQWYTALPPRDGRAVNLNHFRWGFDHGS